MLNFAQQSYSKSPFSAAVECYELLYEIIKRTRKAISILNGVSKPYARFTWFMITHLVIKFALLWL